MNAPTIPLDGQRAADAQQERAIEGPNSRSGQARLDGHPARAAAGPNSLDGQSARDAQPGCAVEGPTSRPAMTAPTSISQAPGGTPTPPTTSACATPTARPLSEASRPRAAAMAGATPIRQSPQLADPLLALAADVLDDLERVRIANENRLRQLTRSTEDSDGETRGLGLPVEHPDVARLAGIVEGLAKLEHDAELQLKRQMRRHPIGPWVKQARGIGEKQAARLLAAIGDPYWNDLHDRPRLVSELWSYAGYGDAAAQVRRRGEKANWSADAKMRAFLVAVSIVKAGGPYREVYDEARAKYVDAVHAVECRRCGPSGKPAQPGSSLSDGHRHARALRAVSKAVLRDLWREAKRLHENE